MKILSNSVNDTIKIGMLMAKYLTPGDIICLFGQFGAGKTVLVKGIARGLGIKTNRIVSPSFILIQEYKEKIPFYHFDLYRLKDPKNILDLGYEEYFYNDGVTVIEWAERLKYLLPRECLKIKLFIKTDSERVFQVIAFGGRYKKLLKKIDENIRH